MTTDLPSLDFIAGLIAGEGSFMIINQNNNRVHVFQLKMHADERQLFDQIKIKLGLLDPIYEYAHQNRHYVMLLIRKRETIIRKIIPTFDDRLFGLKRAQYENWRKSFCSSILNSKAKRYLINEL